jgi:hypothetical protein
MTKASAATKKEVQFNVNEVQGIVTIGNATIEVSADGKKVGAYAPDGFEVKAAASTETAAEDKKISVSKDFNAVVLNGVTIEQAADGHLIITAPGGTVINKPAPANDTAIQAAQEALKLGVSETEDGFIYAGQVTRLGQVFNIFAAPKDLPVLDYYDTVRETAKLNGPGSVIANEYELDTAIKNGSYKGESVIAPLDVLEILKKNQDEGALKGTFNTTNKGSGAGTPNWRSPNWYWSSTQSPSTSDGVYTVCFSGKGRLWDFKGVKRLSSRPVRLIAASATPALG